MQPRFRWFFLSLLLTASLPVRAAAEPPDEALRQLSLTDEELARGRWERAVHHARSALTLDPEGGQAWLLLGLAEAGRGQQAPAEKALSSSSAFPANRGLSAVSVSVFELPADVVNA